MIEKDAPVAVGGDILPIISPSASAIFNIVD
jgi:hypothetical protein